MGVPKKKRSKSRKKSRASQGKLVSPRLAACPQCKAPILPHFACPKCGYYKGRQAFIVKKKKKKTEETG